MSTKSTTDEPVVQPFNDHLSFTDWKPESERKPTEEQKDKARQRTLEIGNRTEIAHRQADPRNQDYYERLDKHNRDCIWKYREDVNISRKVDNGYKRSAVLAIGGELGLSSLQKQKVLERLFQLNLSKFGYRIEVVIFCLCGLVLNEEAKERYDEDYVYRPARNPENNDPAFAKLEAHLIERFDVIKKTYIQTVYAKLEQATPPTRSKSSWESFVANSAIVQRNPSTPNWCFNPNEDEHRTPYINP